MRKLILIGGIAAFAAAALIVAQRAWPNPLPTPAPSPAPTPPSTGPTITWSVSQLTQTMFPGASSTVNVSFRSDQNLSEVVVDVTPSLTAIVSANPPSFASITANQSYQVTLTLSAPPAFIKRSIGGTIHLRNGSSPPKTYSPALSVNLQTAWNGVTDASSGLTFALPELSPPPVVNDIGATSDALFAIYIGALNPSDNATHSLIELFAFSNSSQEEIRTWFEQNVDDASGTLLASGAFQQQQLTNGPALVQVAPIPASYRGGPVAEGYVLPAPRDRVYAISQSQDSQLTDFGYASSSVPGILRSILGSVQ